MRLFRPAARLLATVLVVGVGLGVLGPDPAAALDVRASAKERVLGDVDRRTFEVRLGDGALARGSVVSFGEADPAVQLRPVLAQGTAAGLQRYDQMALQQVGAGAVVGINGGYHLRRPWGAPNGLHVEAGRLVAGDSVGLRGDHTARGMLGIHTDGSLVMDRLRTTLQLDVAAVHGDLPLAIDELNRQVRNPDVDETRAVDGELLLFDDRFGAPIAIPPAAIVLVLDGLGVRSSGRTEGVVEFRSETAQDTSLRVPAGRHVLVAYGSRLGDLFEVLPGHQLGVTTTIEPYNSAADLWADLEGGLAGGQLLVQNSQRRSLEEWRTQNFGESHITSRQPRTAIGRTADGRVLLVTVDGRQPGWSSGLTVRELADTMLALGAQHALNLDGGGSTTMTVDARPVNRPSEVGRSVSSGLFVFVEPPPGSRGLTQACPVATMPAGGFGDVSGTTHATAIDCLAWWGVTSGVTTTAFAPGQDITRGQMASFLARWIDDLAARGAGRALPTGVPLRFDDVSATSAHAGPIARLADAGIIAGRTTATFEPLAPVSRAQTATLVRQTLEHVTGGALPGRGDTFVDDNGSVHEPNIDVLAGVQVIAGTSTFSFRPSVPVSRGAMASLLKRASDLLVEQGLVTPPA